FRRARPALTNPANGNGRLPVDAHEEAAERTSLNLDFLSATRQAELRTNAFGKQPPSPILQRNDVNPGLARGHGLDPRMNLLQLAGAWLEARGVGCTHVFVTEALWPLCLDGGIAAHDTANLAWNSSARCCARAAHVVVVTGEASGRIVDLGALDQDVQDGSAIGLGGRGRGGQCKDSGPSGQNRCALRNARH